MISSRTKKPLTELGKFIAKQAINLNWTRAELAAQIGVSQNLLHRLMHDSGYKLESVDKVIRFFREDITDEMAAEYRAGAKSAVNRYVFETVPDTPMDWFVKAIHTSCTILPKDVDEPVLDASIYMSTGVSIVRKRTDEIEWPSSEFESQNAGQAANSTHDEPQLVPWAEAAAESHKQDMQMRQAVLERGSRESQADLMNQQSPFSDETAL